MDPCSSFLAGALPLSMTLSPSQLRLISTIGMGVLVGTSLIVIIPEGIEAMYTAGSTAHSHGARSLSLPERGSGLSWVSGVNSIAYSRNTVVIPERKSVVIPRSADIWERADAGLEARASLPDQVTSKEKTEEKPATPPKEDDEHHDSPTFYIGLSLILGFILMFLIDKLPRHASEKLQSPQAPRQISLNNLGTTTVSSGDEESDSFLHSLAPSPKQSRSLATTTGLVIHAAADGIAMGASASTSNTKLGFIIFIAIMVHKAPAAFGLTSVLLKQGLSKRAARGHLIVFSLAAPIGAITTFLLVHILGGGRIEGAKGQWWTGMLLLFSGGTFL
jgi:zinc transporter 9